MIVGSGPAGAATALALHRQAPQLAREIVVLDKARHPRSKVCAGGVIPAGRNWLAGYRWSFPCLIDGEPHANIGVFSLTRGGALIKDAMAAELAMHGSPRARHVAFPIRWYRRGVTRVAADNVLLAGDAAGADPLMGEGISFALENGSYAAAAALECVRTGDYSGLAYQRQIDRSWLGIKLGRLHATAGWFYSRYWRLCFALPERSLRLRTLGLRWYNGIDDWDRKSIFDAARALLRPDFTAPRLEDGRA